MHYSTSIPALAIALSTLIVVACDKNPAEQSGARLTLSADSLSVHVGTSASVAVTVLNTSEPAQYVSRDRSVATVTGNGGIIAISGVAVGSTYVVATLSSNADVRDSVRVRVQPPDTCAVKRPDFGGPATAADRALFAYDASAPLNLSTVRDSTKNGVEIYSISYDSPGGGSVPGIMYRPVGRSGLRPGIVVMHASSNPTGPAQGAKIAQFQMQELAERGAVVVGIDAPYVRRNGWNSPRLPPETRDRAEHIQLMKDLQRAVDVLLAEGNVDPARIGFSGYSHGAMIGVHFAGIERRLKAAVITAGYGGNVTAATNKVLLPDFGKVACATRNAWLRDNVSIEPIRFIPGASPTALLFQIGRFDTAVPLEDAQAVYDAASSPKEVLYYDSGHALPPQANADRLAWLSKQIGTDP
jgi:dienelactone hydrolase